MSKLENTLPKNGICLIGIVLTDIYHKEDWNYGNLIILLS